MPNTLPAFCGLRCDDCSFREATNCPGCRTAKGQLFWGPCALAQCCLEKGHDHCGQCADFPCEQLRAFSYDAEHGDNGARIRNLESLRA